MSLDTNNTFNVDFECPVHSDSDLGFKYLTESQVLYWGYFLVYTFKKFTCSALAFLGLLFSFGGLCAIGDSCSAINLRVKVSFNCFYKKRFFIIVQSKEKLKDKSIACYGCLETN